MRAYHLTWSTSGRQPAFPSEEVRRDVLRAVARVAGMHVVLFALVDDHVHVVVFVDSASLGRLSRSLTMVLTHRAAVPLAPVWVQPVESRGHMATLPRYCLGQLGHHGLPGHPATATGSCFPDLVGARRVPGLGMPLLQALPRFRQRDAYEHVGLPPVPLAPATDDQLRALGAVRLADLVAQALAVGPALVGNRAEVVEARGVVGRLAAECGLRSRDVAHALGVTDGAAWRLARREVEAATLRAARLRVALEVAVGAVPVVVRDSASVGYEGGAVA